MKSDLLAESKSREFEEKPLRPGFRRVGRSARAATSQVQKTASLVGAVVANEPPGDLRRVGHVVAAFGVAGQIRVSADAGPESVLGQVRQWWVKSAKGCFPHKMRSARVHGEFWLASLDGVLDRNAAEALKGSEVFLERSRFPKAKADEVYWGDLIGLPVITVEGVALGVIRSVQDHGAHGILSVEGVDSVERLIPLVPAYVKEIETNHALGSKVVVDWSLDW